LASRQYALRISRSLQQT